MNIDTPNKEYRLTFNKCFDHFKTGNQVKVYVRIVLQINTKYIYKTQSVKWEHFEQLVTGKLDSVGLTVLSNMNKNETYDSHDIPIISLFRQ